jgi:hypothetical protein
LDLGLSFLDQPLHPFFEYKRLFYNRKTTPFIFFIGGTLLHIGGDNESDNESNPYPQYNYPYNYKGGASLGFGTDISGDRNVPELWLQVCPDKLYGTKL